MQAAGRERPAAIGRRSVEHGGTAGGRRQRRRRQPYAGDLRPSRRGLSRRRCFMPSRPQCRETRPRASSFSRRLKVGACAWWTQGNSPTRPIWPIRSIAASSARPISMAAIARHSGAQILSGANLDDLREYRPGLEAAKRHSVRHPYLEAGIDKTAVRSLARELGLGALSELPAAPCLSSRVETGIAIRAEVLRAIHAVERSIAKDFPAGIVRCRVRAKGIVIELDPETLAAITGSRGRTRRASRWIGFSPELRRWLDLSFALYRNGGAFVHSRA